MKHTRVGMNRVTVKSIEVNSNKLTIDFDCTGQIKKFFRDSPFFVEYNISIEDIPESILVIPFLSTVCPIAWANQAGVYVETIDETFLHSLENVRLALQKFYPQIIFSSKIYANKIVASHINVQPKAMMLFTGGVDALTTYIRHQIENPVLVAVHGVDIAVDDYRGWQVATKILMEFSKTTGATLRTIRSNFYALLDKLMLKIYDKRLNGDWWNRVMHGLAFLGLCAPLTYIDKIGKLYIASSFTTEFQKPWGSAPEIDNNVRWTGTTCVHDGYELTRQEKIQVIAEYIKLKHAWLHIRTCFKPIKGENCNKCEKCSRTITGLELAGINPNNHGFDVDTNTFSNIKENLMNTWSFGDDEVYMWTDLQRHTYPTRNLPHPDAEELINWLINVNMKTARSKLNKPQMVLKIIIPSFKYMPYPVCRAIGKVFEALKSLS